MPEFEKSPRTKKSNNYALYFTKPDKLIHRITQVVLLFDFPPLSTYIWSPPTITYLFSLLSSSPSWPSRAPHQRPKSGRSLTTTTVRFCSHTAAPPPPPPPPRSHAVLYQFCARSPAGIGTASRQVRGACRGGGRQGQGSGEGGSNGLRPRGRCGACLGGGGTGPRGGRVAVGPHGGAWLGLSMVNMVEK